MDYYPTLQGMCEVVMNDDDGDAPSQEASESYLPPIPQFDLQSEHLNYALHEQPHMPMIFDYDPYGPLLQPFQTILETRLMPKTPKTPKTPKPKLAPKITTPKPKKEISIEKREKKERKEFAEKLFPKEFSATVFSKQALKDMAGSKEEKNFYGEVFTDVKFIEMCRIHCTICDKHVGCGPQSKEMVETHMMLDVLVCKKCHEFYGDGKFPLDKTDDTEIYCRWCGQGGEQICCSFCPKVFCNKCVKRNFSLEYLKNIQAEDDWACFCCAAKPLWPLRAICRALKSYLENATLEADKAVCCVKKQKKEKIVTPVKAVVPKPEFTGPKPEWTGPNQPYVLLDKLQPQQILSKSLALLVSPPRQTRTAKGASPLPTPEKTVRQNKKASTTSPLPVPTAVAKPAILGRPRITPVPLSRLTKPQPPPSPVTSPRGRGRPRLYPVAQALTPQLQPQRGRPPAQPQKPRPPIQPRPVFSSVPPPANPLEPPTVVIDHSYQKTLAVRIKIPSKPDQFLRINVIGSCMRVPPFPPPQKRTFVQHCLKQAFRASEMSYHNLMSIVGNIENHSENENKDAVLAYLDKWKRVITTLENDVLRNAQKFDAKTTQSNVINVEEDDIQNNDDEINGLKWGWLAEASRLEFCSDDIQILEEKPKNSNKRKTDEVPSARKRRKMTQETLVDNNEPGPSNGVNYSPAVAAASNGFGDASAADQLAELSKNDATSPAVDPPVEPETGGSSVAADELADSSVLMKDLVPDSGISSSVPATDLLDDAATGGARVPSTDPLTDATIRGSSASTVDPLDDSATGVSSFLTTTDPLADSAADGSSVLPMELEADSCVLKVPETDLLPTASISDPICVPELGLNTESSADLLPDVLNGTEDLSSADPLLADPLSVADFAHPMPDSSICEDNDNLKIEKLSKVIEEICDSSLAQHGAEPDLMNLLDGDLNLVRQND